MPDINFFCLIFLTQHQEFLNFFLLSIFIKWIVNTHTQQVEGIEICGVFVASMTGNIGSFHQPTARAISCTVIYSIFESQNSV